MLLSNFFSFSFRLQHEAGHFLIAYLVGILPKGYTLSSLEALQKEGSLNVQAGTAFVDLEFLEEVGCFSNQNVFPDILVFSNSILCSVLLSF